MTIYRFDQIAELITSRVSPGDTLLDRFVGLEHLDPDSLKLRRWGTPSDVIGEKLHFWPGDIIYAKRRAYQRKLAVAEFEGICSAHAMVLRARPDVCLPELLPFFMQSEIFNQRAVEISVGSLSPTINWSALARQEFPLPPIDEQRRIADLLWAADDVIQGWESTKRSATQLLETTLATTFVSNSPLNDEKNWQIAPLSDVAFLQTGIAKGKQYNNEIETVELPYLSVLNVQDGFIDLSGVKQIILPKKDVERYRLKPGDIVIAEGGDSDKVGRGAIWRGEINPCLHQNHVFVIRTNKEKILSEFLSFQMRSKYGKAYFLKSAKKTSNLASINSTQVKQFPVLLCSLDAQNKIILRLTQLEQALTHIEKHLSVSINLKKSLLAEFFGQ
jgi:type I restriction enzyme S subunit